MSVLLLMRFYYLTGYNDGVKVLLKGGIEH